MIIKGSEIVPGPWTHVLRPGEIKAAPGQMLAGTWKVKLCEEFFTDKDFPTSYNNRSKRWVSQVFMQDNHVLQMIGATLFTGITTTRT